MGVSNLTGKRLKNMKDSAVSDQFVTGQLHQIF